MWYETQSIRRAVQNFVVERLPAKSSELFFAGVADLLHHVGIVPVHAAAEELETKDYYDILLKTSSRDDDEVDYSILEAVGLIRRVETDFFDVGDWALLLRYYYLTQLGYHFALACGLVDLDFPTEED